MTLAGVRILLAEDNPTNQLVAAQMLESLGASVTLARDGAEALELAERQSFDAMLIDIEMPRVSGIDVIRRLRESPGPEAETPMIALTAYVMREHRAAIDAAGADGIIAKPIISIEQFGADIRQCMARRGGRPQPTGGQSASVPDVAPPPIDRNVYDSLARTIGSSAMAELLDKVEADVETARDSLAEGLKASAADKIRSSTHVLMSVAGAVGATQVQEGARRVNAAVRPEDPAAISTEATALLGEIDRVLNFVRAERRG